MANSLDIIQVRYGQKTGEEKTISYPEFLALDSAYLSEREQALQAAMKKLYHLNESVFPLYKEFPNWRPDKPLTIDITKVDKKSGCGSYGRYGNDIRICEEAFDGVLFLTLAHELKHAEDCTKESYDFENELRLEDGLGYHHIGILSESRARACELTGIMLDCLNEKNSVDEFQTKLKRNVIFKYVKAIMPELKKRYEKALCTGQPLDVQEMQQVASVAIVPSFIISGTYKDIYFHNYNDICEIMTGDKGLQQLPSSFGIAPEYQEALLTILRASFQKGKPVGMVATNILKKLNVETDLAAFLDVALETGLIEEAKAAIQAGANVDEKGDRGQSILQEKVYYGSTNAVKLLLELGADINAKNKYGYTPIHLAVDYSHIEIVKMLVKAGVDLSAKNNYAETPLDCGYGLLIRDYKKKDSSNKLSDQKKQDLLEIIRYLEKQKAPCGRYLKAKFNEIKRNIIADIAKNKKAARQALHPVHEACFINAQSLILGAVIGVGSFLLGKATSTSRAELEEGFSSLSKMVQKLLPATEKEQKGIKVGSMLDAALILLQDKSLDAKKKQALVETPLLLIEKGQKPTLGNLKEVLKDPSIKALFEQSEKGKAVVDEVMKVEPVSKQPQASVKLILPAKSVAQKVFGRNQYSNERSV